MNEEEWAVQMLRDLGKIPWSEDGLWEAMNFEMSLLKLPKKDWPLCATDGHPRAVHERRLRSRNPGFQLNMESMEVQVGMFIAGRYRNSGSSMAKDIAAAHIFRYFAIKEAAITHDARFRAEGLVRNAEDGNIEVETGLFRAMAELCYDATSPNGTPTFDVEALVSLAKRYAAETD